MTDANFLDYPSPMDREMLKRHLALAEEHIATGEKNIARQRDLIAQLEWDGHETASQEPSYVNSNNCRPCT